MKEVNPNNRAGIKDKYLKSTGFLVFGTLLLSLIVIASGGLINRYVFNSSLGYKFESFFVIPGAAIAAISGIVVIKRREMPRPGLYSISGNLAVIYGTFWIVICIAAILGMIYALYVN